MTKYKCECLNVTLHVKEKSVREVNGDHFVTDPVGFFAGKICEVGLAVAGITKEVASLVCQSRVEDWDIFTCTNCGNVTHALHAVKGYDRVLINKALENNEDALKQKIKSPKYSKLFKIIVEPVKGSESSDRLEKGGAVLLDQKTLSLSMILVEEQVKKFLRTEEEAMEDRIRKVVEKEKEAFAAVQTQALKDKRAIHSVLAKAEEKALQTSLNEAMAETSRNPMIVPSKSLSDDSWGNKVEKPDTKRETVNHVHITQAPPTRIPNLNFQDPLRHKPKRRQQNFLQKNASVGDGDAMFALDGFTEDCEPFFESEEDDLSSDNSFQNEESNNYYSMMSKMVVRGNKRAANYSSSVPIHMPPEHKPATNPWDDDDDDEFAIPEPSKIGESMKALAQSLQESVFGELPRPRLKTDPMRESYK